MSENVDGGPWEFRAPIEQRHMGGSLFYTVVHLPRALESALPAGAGPSVRVYAVVEDVDFDAAFQSAHGRWSLMVSKALQKKLGKGVGDVVDVRFSLAPADAVDVPDALRVGLRGDAAAAQTFAGLTAGKQRALCHRVGSAKTPPTQQRRVAEIVDVLAGGPAAVAAFFGRKMTSTSTQKASTKKASKKKASKKKTSKPT
jgi:hypothetical protein